MATPDHLEVAVVVLHAHRDVVTGLEPGGAEEPAEAIGGGVELGEGLGEPGPAHDHGGLVGVRFEVGAWEHTAAR